MRSPHLPPRRRFPRPQMLPTALTLGNLFCGYLAIAKALDALALPHVPGEATPEMLRLLEHSGWLIFLGMVFDALDGRVARLSGGSSATGAQLDSLADVVSFGVAPALLAKAIAEGVGGMENRQMSLYFSVFFALMAALRLARYTAAHGDPEEAQLWFDGLPTPGAAAVIAGLAILLPDRDFRPEGAVLRFLPVVTLLLGFAMVSRLPYAHVANRFLRGRKPLPYVVLGLLALVLSLTFHVEAVLAGMTTAYALSGPVAAIFRRRSPAAQPSGVPAGFSGPDRAPREDGR